MSAIRSKNNYSKWLQYGSAGILILFWFLTLVLIRTFPDEIPVHFNLSGVPDKYGSKSTAYWLPIIATFVYFFLMIINRHPDKFNYPFSITKNTASKHYQLAQNLIRWMQIIIVLIFLMVFLTITTLADPKFDWIQKLLVPFIFLSTFAPIIIYLFLASRVQNKEN